MEKTDEVDFLNNYIEHMFELDNKKEEFDLYYCNDCESFSNILLDGRVTCKICYRDYGITIDTNAEWRNYTSDGSKGVDHTRCSSIINPMLIESSYGSTIGFTKDPQYIKLKKTLLWNSSKYPEKMLKSVFHKLTINGTSGGLTTNIIEYSHKLFYDLTQKRNELNMNSSRGDINEGVIACCTMQACKKYGFYRTPKDIAKMYNISKSDVTTGWNLFKKLLPQYANDDDDDDEFKMALIKRYCHYLNMTEDHIDKVRECVEKVESKKILSKNTPGSLICGCIYFVIVMLGLKISRNELSEKCDISIATINKTYQILIDYTDELI